MAYTPFGYYGGYNPYPRMEYLPQAMQQPVQAPQTAGGNNNAGGLLCRPVASRLEAETAQIPFDGSTHLFYDTSADCLYSKTFNPANGTAPLVTYVREAPPPVVQYVTMEQFETVMAEIERLKKPAGKKVVKNDDPDE